jgi:hypothetical protein
MEGRKRGAPPCEFRQLAIKQGVVTYSNGRPCRRGHMSPRYTRTGICVACARERDRDTERAARKAARPVTWGKSPFAALMAVWGIPAQPPAIDLEPRVHYCLDLE